MDTRWCNYYGCWVKDVEELVGREPECGLNCKHCVECEGRE